MVRTVLVCAIPLALILLYLLTVLQVMGIFTRYDIPYCELIILPALLVLDDAICGYETDERKHFALFSFNRFLGLIAAVFLLATISIQARTPRWNDVVLGKWHVYEQPVLTYAAIQPLPTMNGTVAIQSIANDFVRALSAGTSLAATEVGYVGAVAPQVDVLDMAGLNDPAIALHGFDVTRFLERKPDILWLPHIDYTYQRGVLLTDPELLRQYTVYAGAFSYGLAIRKDSPRRDAIDAALQRAWAQAYPGYDIGQYVVQKVTWSRRKYAAESQ